MSEKSSWKRFRKLSISGRSFNTGARKLEKVALRHAHRFVVSRFERMRSVQRQVFGWVILIVALIGISFAQLIISRNAYMTAAPADGGSYSEGVIGPLESLNPLFARSSAERSAGKLLFSRLYSYDDTGHIRGDLATGYTVSKDQKQYTVSIRKDAKWSDGKPLTAHDVAFTVNLIKNPATGSTISGWNSIDAEATDDTTVIFTLPGAYASFVHALNFPILPQHTLGKTEPENIRQHSFTRDPVTSGPFAVRLVQDINMSDGTKVLHMSANESYYMGSPKLSRFQLHVYGSRVAIAKALRTNEINATADVPLDEAKVSSRYTRGRFAVNDGVFALFNTKHANLESTAVRQALSLAIDRTDLRKQLSNGTFELNSPIIDYQIDTTIKQPEHNIKKANSLLQKEGWQRSDDDALRTKKGKKLSLSIVSLKDANHERAANYLAKIWREQLGVDVTVRVVDQDDGSQDVLQSILRPREFDVLIYELVLGGDPDNYAYWHSSQATPNGLNFSNYVNGIADDAVTSGRSTLDRQKRNHRYSIFVNQWQKDAPALALYRPGVDYITTRSVSAARPGAVFVTPVDRYANVTEWSSGETNVYKTP